MYTWSTPVHPCAWLFLHLVNQSNYRAMRDCFFILPINLTIKSWTFTVFGLWVRSTASVSFPVLLRIMHIYVEERTLTLSSSFNARISNPQHVGESSKSIAGTKCMLLEDQTLTLPSFFNCTILLTSGGILHWVMASVKSVDGIFERRLRKWSEMPLLSDPSPSDKYLGATWGECWACKQ